MNTTYYQAAEKVNAAVLFFVNDGYHVTTAFGSDHSSMEVTVYFYENDDRNLLESFMTRYKDDNDAIVFNKFETVGSRKFYTLTLIKYPS